MVLCCGRCLTPTTCAARSLLLQGKLLRVKTQLERRIEDLKEDRSDGDKLLAEIRDLTDRVLTLETAHHDAVVEIHRLNDETARLSSENESLSSRLAASESTNERLSSELAVAGRKEAVVVASLKAVLARELQLLERTDAQEAERVRLVAELETANTSIASLSAELSTALARIGALEAHCADYDTKVSQLRAALAAKRALESELATTQAVLAERTTELERLTATHAELVAAAAADREAMREMRHSLWSHDVQIRELRRCIRDAEAAAESERQARAVEAKKHAAAFRDAAAFSQAESAGLASMLADARTKLQAQHRYVRALEHRTEDLADELTRSVTAEGATPPPPRLLAPVPAPSEDALANQVNFVPIYASDTPACRRRNYLLSAEKVGVRAAHWSVARPDSRSRSHSP